jgi:hypothetical protein
VLHAAFDQIAGKGRWRLGSRGFGGTFAVRFPHSGDPGDDGWHIDVSFPPDDGNPNEQSDFSAWRVNVRSRGRALLMLFLFSDAGPRDAPTRIRVGSHIDMARFLAPAGDAGMSHRDMALDQMGADRPEALATGDAGTVYLCHPFLVHAAQRHQGTAPRFMAQPPLHPDPAEPIRLEREDGDYSPVEIAIRRALEMA